MIYPIHMQRKRTAGDVRFGKKDSTGLHISKITLLDPTEYNSEIICSEFHEGGTGFIITPLGIRLKINNEKHIIIGLVITACHVVCDPTTFKPID